MRLFADGGRVVRHATLATGFRLSLDLLNLTDDRQRVRDSSGNPPLQYQSAYRDALGRTIELGIRKLF